MSYFKTGREQHGACENFCDDDTNDLHEYIIDHDAEPTEIKWFCRDCALELVHGVIIG